MAKPRKNRKSGAQLASVTIANHGPDHGDPKHIGDYTSTITGKHYAGAKRTEDFSTAVERRRPKARSSSKKYPNQK